MSGPLDGGDSPHSILTDSAGHASDEDAKTIARLVYGVDATVSRLTGERDDNFRLDTPDARWMMKVAHVRESPSVTEFQSAILGHLADTTVTLPRLVPTSSGRPHTWVSGGPAEGRAVRMTTFLQGRSLRSTPVGPALAFELGRTLAVVDDALADFSHPGADVELLWDIQQADRTRELVTHNASVSGANTLTAGLAHVVSTVLPRLDPLPKQVIHNDFNPDNVLVDAQGAVGVLDFGDAVVAPRVIDLAVAASYHVESSESADVLGTALDLIAGYHATSPLTEAEIGLLYELMKARILVAISIASWRAARFPDNDEYISRNTATSRRRLAVLDAADGQEITEQIRRRCVQ
ncbi:phosphotransferase [Rhodococcoides fascians]|uniref:phosphotransferase n=1 Tax=Rhodococcoides fascians TaxID=1828 RepID=UPI000AA8CDDC|nr:phosphotransferase [Rhodococcus fascians]